MIRNMNYGVILLGGASKRFLDPINKQFKKVLGIPLYQYSLKTMVQSNIIDRILLVVSPQNINYVRGQVQVFDKILDVIPGGITRQKSSYEAIKYLSQIANDEDNVFIHDAARPLLSLAMLENLNNALKECRAITLARNCHDTIVRTINFDEVDNFVNRGEVALIETPQAFHLKTIKEAHENAIKNNIFNASDDTYLVKMNNQAVRILVSEENNFKITLTSDFEVFEAMITKGVGQ